MNNFKTLVRVAKDPEKFNTKSGKNGIKFLMAIHRPYSKNREKGAQDADFINGVAFSATADFLERNISKGTRLVVDGALRSDRFQKDGAVCAANEKSQSIKTRKSKRAET